MQPSQHSLRSSTIQTPKNEKWPLCKSKHSPFLTKLYKVYACRANALATIARPFTVVCLKLTSSGRPVGRPTWHKNTSAYHSLGNCITLQTRLVQKPPPQLFRDLPIITPVTVFRAGAYHQIIYNALRDYTCIKTNSA